MKYDGLRSDKKSPGDLFGALSLRHELEHLALARSELLYLLTGPGRARRAAEQVVGNQVGNVFGDEGVAAHYRADRTGELFHRCGLQHISGSASAEHVADDLPSSVHGQPDDLRLRGAGANLAHGLD